MEKTSKNKDFYRRKNCIEALQSKKMVWVMVFFTIFSFFLAGFSAGSYFGQKKTLDNQNLIKTNQEYVKELDGQWCTDGTEDWVCINVRDMDYERALETCRHEVGHEIYYNRHPIDYNSLDSEIFAENCEKNMTECLEIKE